MSNLAPLVHYGGFPIFLKGTTTNSRKKNDNIDTYCITSVQRIMFKTPIFTSVSMQPMKSRRSRMCGGSKEVSRPTKIRGKSKKETLGFLKSIS